MIISRTPFRISFVGGGTDLRSFYSKDFGKVLSSSIDKYIYVVVKRQIGIVEYKFRVNWAKVEFCNEIDEIEHPIVREALRLLDIDYPIEITTFADIPSNTGLGSSSSFAVGLLHALHALKGEMVTKNTLAQQAAQIEVDILKRPIGKQDHYAAAYGNLNTFTFLSDDGVIIDPVFYTPEIKKKFQDSLLLFYTRLKRDAGEVLQKQNEVTDSKREVLKKMRDLVDPLRDVFSGKVPIKNAGEILHQGWLLKSSITEDISSKEIDEFYSKALNAGALGGKLLGAGGGGFLLFFVEPEKQNSVRNSLKDLYNVPLELDTGGTRITYYDQTRI